MSKMPDLGKRLHNIHSRITQAAQRAGRDPADVQLIAVTKNVPVETIRESISFGVRHIGENKVQEAFTKYRQLVTSHKLQVTSRGGVTPPLLTSLRAGDPRLTTAVQWHLIGHLQTNKVRDAVQIFDWIHSVDSLRLAEKINQECEKIQKVMLVLIEVNVSVEGSKFGIAPKELPELVKSCQSLKSIRVEGLMTMAPIVSDPNQARPYFRQLVELRDRIRGQAPNSPSPSAFHLSMGMSQDFEAAIEEGATMVRIGTAIFGI